MGIAGGLFERQQLHCNFYFIFSKSKLIIYDLETNNLSEAVISRLAENQAADQDLEVSNPHDVAVSKDGKEVIVANLNPSQIWLFSDDENKGQLISEQIFSDNRCP